MIQPSSIVPHRPKISEPTSERSGSEIFFSPESSRNRPRIALVASVAWTLWNYRLSLILALEAAGYEVLLLATEDPSRTQLEKHTRARFVPLYQLSRRSISLVQNLKFLVEIFQKLRDQKPDLVLFFTIRPNIFGNIAASLAGIPGIATIEGLGSSGSSRWLQKITQPLYRLAFRHPRKVIFLNNDDLQEFLRLKIIHPEKALLVPGPGVDLDHFSPRKKEILVPKIVFLFVGRLLSAKGIREFAEAARRLKNKQIAAEFQVLGSVDPGNPCTISTQELTSWVQEGILFHLGFLEDVRPAIANADVMVLPSYYREGIPRSILEAMAMAKPILTTDNVGCRDTVTEGENGYLVPSRNVEALVEAMEKFVALSPEQRKEMGRFSRQKVEQAFGDEQVTPHYLDLIQEILGK